MKHISLIIILCYLICSCKGNSNTDTDWNKLEIIGKVKSLEQVAFKMEKEYKGYGEYGYKKGDQIRAMHFMFPSRVCDVKFNKSGYIEEINYDCRASEYKKDINECRLKQSAIYDDNQLCREFLHIENQLIYERSYNLQENIKSFHGIENYNDETLFMAFLARKNPYIDLYSSFGDWRSWIPVKRIDNTRMSFCDTIVVSSNRMYYFFYNAHSKLAATYSSVGYNSIKRENEFYTFYDNTLLKFIGHNNTKEKYRFNYDNDKKNLTEITLYGESSYSQGDELEWMNFDYNDQNNIHIAYHRDKNFKYNGKLYYRKNSVYLNYNLDNQIIFYKRYYEKYKVNENKYKFDEVDYANCVEMKLEYDNDCLIKVGDYYIKRDHYGRLDSVFSSKDTLGFEYHSFEDYSLKNIVRYAELKDLANYTKVETTYDKYGNWISRICFNGDIPVICYERKLEYY